MPAKAVSQEHREPSSRQRWLDLISKTSKIIRDLAGAIEAIRKIFR